MSITSGSVSNIGALATVAKIDADSASAQAHTITAGKSYVIFQNTGTNEVWMGDASVDPSAKRGYQILPNSAFVFQNVTQTFAAYFKCAATESTSVSIVEG